MTLSALAFSSMGAAVKLLGERLPSQEIVLFRAGISPKRAAGRISAPRLARLVETTKQVLHQGIEHGGTTLRDYALVLGEAGGNQHRLQVFQREGQPCPTCGTPVRRYVQSARSTFDCPRCQR